jgi:hypothetical protein
LLDSLFLSNQGPMKRIVPALFFLTVMVCLQSVVWPVQPSQWTFSTQRDFLQGDMKGVSVSSEGTVVLAPSFDQLFDTGEAFIHSAAVDAGGNLFFGTGNNGRIFQVVPGGQSREWAKLSEPGVHAIAVDSTNRVYAGTSPDGKVYRLAADGQAELFFDPQEKYIWALSFDSQNNLYVGTGPKGIIYKVNRQGQGEVFFHSKDNHIVSLKSTTDGSLLAGSAPSAMLYRIAPNGTPFVLFDSPLEELKSIAVDRYGNVFAAAIAGGGNLESGGTGSAEVVVRPASSEASSKTGDESTVVAAGNERGRRLQVYRVDKDNMVHTLYSSNDQMAFDLLVRNDGSVLVATGNKGRIVSIDPRRHVTYLAQCPEEQVTRMVEHGGEIFAATSNLGKVFSLKATPASQGIYESEVLDANLSATWGVLRWSVRNLGSAPVRFFTRSGNTNKPDQTWSDWAGPYQESRGTHIKSPTARYLQWKVEFPQAAGTSALTSPTNVIDFVSVHYMQRNMAPAINSLTVHPSGMAFAALPAVSPSGGTPAGGPEGAHVRSLPRSIRDLDKPTVAVPPRKVYVPGARSLSWSASDPNGDDLTYSVYLRAQDDREWRLLRKDLTETHFTMDGLSLADGTYFARVVVSDAPSNPREVAMESEILSRAFVISNSSPALEIRAPRVEGRSVTLDFTARTTASTLHQAEYSIAAGDWRVLFPVDGVADSDTEEYRAIIENLQPGTHSVVIRVIDSVGNIGTARTTITVPGS